MKKPLLFYILLSITFELCAQMQSAQQAFPFNPYNLTSQSQISARLNHPITEKDRISVTDDGHLQADGKRIRIFGTNLSEFPTSHKQADFYAQALANQGYNCIRFHHTDASWTNCFLKKTESGRWVINEQRLDDFDYFFSKLKENGIYSNINFLTGRSITAADGYKQEINNYSDWKTSHCLGFWNNEALEKQQQYAFDLMTHVNPYTGIAYNQDPAVAIVEINNENGLLMGYLNGWLEDCNGEYWQELQQQWNNWLKKNPEYSAQKLSQKFNRSVPLTSNIITSDSPWNLEQHEGSKAVLTKQKNETVIKIQKNGTSGWHIQYNCYNLSFNSENLYTIKFSAKASKEAKIDVSLMQAHDPWQNAGLSKNINLTTKYQDFEFVVEDISTDDNLRINFGGMGLQAGTTFYLKDISITQGGSILNVKINKDGNIELPHFSEYSSLPAEYKNIIARFLWEKEEQYWLTMKDFVRNTIKSQALIMGTASGCSTPLLQSCFDIIDSHGYWNHPIFTAGSWDVNHYYVSNKDLTRSNSDSTLFNLAKYRVYGKPFCCSEYDHPYPNQYSAQMYPMLASFAAYQDWDCIFTFCHEIPKGLQGQTGKINGYFDQSNNPAKSCAAPIASRIFREFLVEPAQKKAYLNYDKQTELNNLQKFHAWSLGAPEIFGMNPSLSAFYQLGLNIKDVTPPFNQEHKADYINLTTLENINAGEKIEGFTLDNQIYWNQNNGVYIVCNDKVTISIAAPAAKLPAFPKEWLKNDVLQPAVPANDFISFMAVKDQTENQSEKDFKYLIFACSWSGNDGEKLSVYGNQEKASGPELYRPEDKLTTSNSLGKAPAMALGINAQIKINSESSFNLFKTSLNGNKASLIKADSNLWTLNNYNPTLWYILEVKN